MLCFHFVRKFYFCQCQTQQLELELSTAQTLTLVAPVNGISLVKILFLAIQLGAGRAGLPLVIFHSKLNSFYSLGAWKDIFTMSKLK